MTHAWWMDVRRWWKKKKKSDSFLLAGTTLPWRLCHRFRIFTKCKFALENCICEFFGSINMEQLTASDSNDDDRIRGHVIFSSTGYRGWRMPISHSHGFRHDIMHVIGLYSRKHHPWTYHHPKNSVQKSYLNLSHNALSADCISWLMYKLYMQHTPISEKKRRCNYRKKVRKNYDSSGKNKLTNKKKNNSLYNK